jgi:hypothetical protein
MAAALTRNLDVLCRKWGLAHITPIVGLRGVLAAVVLQVPLVFWMGFAIGRR